MKKDNIEKLKIITVLGTRPEIIRLSRILPKMDEYLNHKIIFTQQSYDYELSQIFFKELGLRKPDYTLNVKSGTLGGQIGNILTQTEEVFLKEKPDAVLIIADTNTALSIIIAKRLKIPIFHFEAGNRAFDWDIPEEVNRRIADHLSDYNIVYTEHARRYLIKEDIAQDTIFVVGSPYAEIFEYHRNKILSSKILEQLKLSPKKYFLVSTHREENVDNQNHLKELFAAFEFLADEYDLPIIVTLHPRTKKRLDETEIKISEQVKLCKPFGFFDYNNLQLNAFCVLSDSGSVQEESSILGFPAVLIRKTTERPETFDTGSIILTGFNRNSIAQAVEITVSQIEQGEKMVVYQNYKDTNVSTKVVKIISGLSGIRKYSINRN